MNEKHKEIEFIDNGTAPEFFANGLHDVEVMGAVSRFVIKVLRRKSSGLLYYEPPFTCIIPNEDIGPAITLTLRKLADAAIIPVTTAALHRLKLN